MFRIVGMGCVSIRLLVFRCAQQPAPRPEGPLQSVPKPPLCLDRADFCPQAGQSGQGTSFASFNFPTRFIRHFNNQLFIASNGGTNAFDATASWAADVSWVVSTPWTP